jgi:hypothetical protein
MRSGNGVRRGKEERRKLNEEEEEKAPSSSLWCQRDKQVTYYCCDSCVYNWLIPFRVVAKLFLQKHFEASHSFLGQCIRMQHKPEANAIFFLFLRSNCDDMPLNKLISYHKSLFFFLH